MTFLYNRTKLLYNEYRITKGDYEMKNVVITGAGSGLGASLAKKYHALGYHVTLLGRTIEKLEAIAKDFKNYTIFPLDVSSHTAVESTFQQIKETVGTIDILVNNAGVGYFDLAENLTPNHIDQMIDVNLKGTIYCTQQVLGEMKTQDAGTILNIVSTAGVEGKSTESAYCASKFGVKGFTESILKELADTNVHVHGIYMGGMKTPFWDGIIEEENTSGLMDPEDVADIIIENTKLRRNINVPSVIIKNH